MRRKANGRPVKISQEFIEWSGGGPRASGWEPL